MIPLWAVVYGLAWVAWLVCVIGGLGSTKLLALWSGRSLGFTPSERYVRGLQLTQLDDLGQQLVIEQ
jgi:hypothetical protein